MQGDWTQAIVMLAAIFGVFLWLRNDIKENRKEIDKLRTDMKGDMNQLRTEMKGDMQKLRSDMQGDLRRLETKVDGLDSRLRAVESEQSRVAGLLEGLGLAGVLPGDES
ncbi:MAG: hypothetical protein OXG85_03255 [Chloroflexi bacterium]|nr:hypothetical protein [Chloroflexota bacterium]